jgi:hypothetical protein
MWLAHVRLLCTMYYTLLAQLVMPSRCWRPEQPRREAPPPQGRSASVASQKRHSESEPGAFTTMAALVRGEALSLGLKMLHVKSAVA